MSFPIITDLPQKTQDEIARISALPEALRNAQEQAFLDALSPYLSNEVVTRDSTGLITEAAGDTVPDGETGFKKGAIFVKKDAEGNGTYHNTGDEESATFGLIEGAGEQGDTGVVGDAGDTGTQGDTGVAGDTGAVGDTGVTGDTGANTGDTGVAGPQGDTGVAGDTGVGDQGDTGVQGDTGIQGDTGVAP